MSTSKDKFMPIENFAFGNLKKMKSLSKLKPYGTPKSQDVRKTLIHFDTEMTEVEDEKQAYLLKIIVPPDAQKYMHQVTKVQTPFEHEQEVIF